MDGNASRYEHHGDSIGAGLLLRFILAAGWSPPPLHPGHPLRWPSTTLATTASEAFQYEDCLLDLLSFGAEFGQHFEDVHF